MPKILLAGQDLRLLETRAEVLKKTGGEVACCIGSEALNVAMSSRPELVVLCHSLPYEQAEAIADGVRLCCPETRVLLVVSQLIEAEPHKDAKFDAVTVPEPTRLVARATELLHALPHPHIIAAEKQGWTALKPDSGDLRRNLRRVS